MPFILICTTFIRLFIGSTNVILFTVTFISMLLFFFCGFYDEILSYIQYHRYQTVYHMYGFREPVSEHVHYLLQVVHTIVVSLSYIFVVILLIIGLMIYFFRADFNKVSIPFSKRVEYLVDALFIFMLVISIYYLICFVLNYIDDVNDDLLYLKREAIFDAKFNWYYTFFLDFIEWLDSYNLIYDLNLKIHSSVAYSMPHIFTEKCFAIDDVLSYMSKCPGNTVVAVSRGSSLSLEASMLPQDPASFRESQIARLKNFNRKVGCSTGEQVVIEGIAKHVLSAADNMLGIKKQPLLSDVRAHGMQVRKDVSGFDMYLETSEPLLKLYLNTQSWMLLYTSTGCIQKECIAVDGYFSFVLAHDHPLYIQFEAEFNYIKDVPLYGNRFNEQSINYLENLFTWKHPILLIWYRDAINVEIWPLTHNKASVDSFKKLEVMPVSFNLSKIPLYTYHLPIFDLFTSNFQEKLYGVCSFRHSPIVTGSLRYSIGGGSEGATFNSRWHALNINGYIKTLITEKIE